jgi:thiamine pyrophosphokinase
MSTSRSATSTRSPRTASRRSRPPLHGSNDIRRRIALAPARILVVGSDGGRLDHLLGSLLLLADGRYAGAKVDALLGATSITVVRGTRSLTGTPGDLVSLLPLHGDAEGVTTEGLDYPLRNETLGAGTTRGVSNVFTGSRASVAVERGCVIVVRPAAEERS